MRMIPWKICAIHSSNTVECFENDDERSYSLLELKVETKEYVRKIIDLAVPATIENILQTMVGFIDTLMIARLGLVAVTAVGLANNILAVYLAIFIALGVGTSSLISRYLGADKKNSAKGIAKQSTVLALMSGLSIGLITLLFGRQLLALMGADQGVLDEAYLYFAWVGAGSVFLSLITVFGSILRATGDTKTPMVVNTQVNLLNIALDYLLIFGVGPFPALGVLGTAIGTVLARVVGCILLWRNIEQSPAAFSLSEIWKGSSYKELINLSLPAAAERLVMRLGQVVYFGLIVSIGIKTYAAHSIAGNIGSFTYMPGYGLATAAAVLVGNSFGAGKKKDSYYYGKISSLLGIGVMSVGGLFLFLGAPWFATWFTGDTEAIAKIVTALRIDAFNQPALAVGLILAGSLQGLGDTKSPLYSTAVGMWGVRVVGVYLLSIVWNMDIAGVWISIGIDLFIRAIFLSFKFYNRTVKA